MNYSDISVAVIGEDDGIKRMFLNRGMKVAKYELPSNAFDIAVFTGGADVSPFLYGEDPMKGTYTDWKRDRSEIKAFKSIRALKPKIGICRGAQFANVMSGGRMWQDCDGHRGTHMAFDIRTKKLIEVTSTHHQMMRPATNATYIAYGGKSTYRDSDDYRTSQKYAENEPEKWRDTEVIWYDNTKSLCFQPHPEYHNVKTEDYFFDLVDEFLLPLIKKNKETQ